MAKAEHRYFILNKPHNMVSQFVSRDKVGLLGDLNYQFPEGTHAIGRLDSHSEGLLILTTNKKVTRLLFQGTQPHKRTYLVEVNYLITEESLRKLQTGVSIRIAGGGYYTTTPCDVSLVGDPTKYLKKGYYTNPFVSTSWILISLTEGKFHQVRKMVTAVGHRCKRLIRVSIEDITLDGLAPGEIREINETSFFEQLKITNWS